MTVLRWDGRAWRIVRQGTVPGTTHPQIKALGGGAVLVTGLTPTQDTHLEWRFDGRAWKDVRTKVDLHSHSGRYAIGHYPDRQDLARWTGKRWQRFRVGARPPMDGDDVLHLSLLEAASAKRIWVVATGISGEGEVRGTFLLRWDGARWRRERVPLPSARAAVRRIAADGRGGLWLSGTVAGSSAGAAARPLLYHRSASGAWKKVRTTTSFADLARVPGTAAHWALGSRGYDFLGLFTRGGRR